MFGTRSNTVWGDTGSWSVAPSGDFSGRVSEAIWGCFRLLGDIWWRVRLDFLCVAGFSAVGNSEKPSLGM